MKVGEVPRVPSEAEQSEEIESEIQEDYEKTVKSEADKHISEEQEKATAEFQRLHGMGFVSKTDLTKENTELKERLQSLETEFTKLREFLLRRKAQGKAVIPTEEKKTEAQELHEIYGDFAPEEMKE